MKHLLVHLKDYKKECVLGPLFKLLEVVFELLVPMVVASLIDKGIGNGDKGYIVRMFLVLVIFGLIGLTASITAQYFAAKASTGFTKKLRDALFSHIQEFTHTELDELGTSGLITRMTSDMNQVQTGVNLTLRLLLRSPFVVFGAMLMAFQIDVKAALIFVVTIPVLSIVVFGIMFWCIPKYRKVQEGIDNVLSATRENLMGVRVLRAFCKEEEEITGFQKKNKALTDIQTVVARISSLMNPVTYVIINIAIVVLIWTGALQVEAGLLTRGAVVALYNYMSQILVELIKLANLILNMTKAIACGNRIQSVFECKPGMEEKTEEVPDKNAPYSIECRNVTFRYKHGGENVLENINLKVKHGEIVGIIGGTGSGKTSLVNLLLRFYDATEGEVLVDGVNVKEYPFEQLRKKIAIVQQKAVLFHGTIRENLQWGKENATDEEIYEALEIAQGVEVVEGKEGKLDYMIEQGGKNLSGGQKQRLSIARALLQEASVLVLDDSSSALDYATDAALRKALHNKRKGKTVFMVSQRTASIRHADRIVVLEDGKMVGMGTHNHLLEQCEVYQEIHYSQFAKEDRVNE